MSSRIPALLVTLALASAPPTALAAGMFVPAIGTPALGSGGAYVASGIDPLAIWYNPANLADLAEGRHFALDVAFIHSPQTFRRATDSGLIELPDSLDYEIIRDYPLAENQAGLFQVPGLFAAFGGGDWALGAGVWGPYKGRFAYDPDGPTRYTLISDQSYTAWAGLAAAHAWGPLRLGGGVQLAPQGVNAEFKAMTLPHELGDALVTGRSDNFSWTWNLGLTLVGSDTWRAGLSYQSPTSIDGEIDLAIDLPDFQNLLGIAVVGDQAEYELELADLVRGGIARRFGDCTWVELAAVFENWSNTDTLYVTPDQIVVEGLDDTLDVTTVAYDYKDAYSIRFGVRHEPGPGALGWRLGALYESTSVKTQNFFVGQSPERLGLSGGFRYGLGRGWSLDLSGVHYIQPEVVVDQTENRPDYLGLGEFETAPDTRGSYRSSYTIVALGLRCGP